MSHAPTSPRFHFALSPDEPGLTPESELWPAPLPASRLTFGQTNGDYAIAGPAMTHGDYFTATRHFLSQDNFSLLCDAAGQVSGTPVTLARLDRVCVYLVKFGALYHPSYVVVTVAGRDWPFVLNVAVSPEGRKIIAREYESLVRLNAADLSAPFWPRVYGFGQGQCAHNQSIPMFLGQWFDGFYEFHLTGEDPQHRQVVVWDTESGHRTLHHDQVKACMAAAACILAQAYNPLTFEAIGRWHHAAGDFVIELSGDNLDLRMITVRDYTPMIQNDQPDVASILDGLLVFLLGISLRLRLDRLDGIGRIACYPDDVVPAICRGFFQGLQTAAPLRGLPEDFHTTVKEYAMLHGADQLIPMALAIIEKSAFNDQEQDLLRRNLDRHVTTLVSAISA